MVKDESKRQGQRDEGAEAAYLVEKDDKTPRREGFPAEEEKMTTEHVKIRRKIKDIADINTFNELLDASTLSSEDKEILGLIYIEKKDFRFIGDMYGYSESTIKYRHKKALKKLMRLF